MSVSPSSRNDIAWQAIFQEENVLDKIARDGCFYISSERINHQREARLMTKFDHHVQLPKLFRDHRLSIQPVSRGGYVIGHFSSYFTLPDNRALSSIQYLDLPPHLETVNHTQISTESSAILCAYLSGMIADILQEETLFTVFGRMSSGSFDYEIYDAIAGKNLSIEVKNSQCEIDGGFEGSSKFAIIEAKCQSVDDFIIRQLYYPYRLWKSKINKVIVPIFLSFSNNIFTFYVFNFPVPHQYNSIQLQSVHRYCIGHYEIELSDIRQVFDSITTFEDDNHLTFPQADKFIRIIDLLDKLYLNEEPLTKEAITTQYAFDVRQTEYYISAGVYLGIFERLPGGSGYVLSNRGRGIMQLDPRRRNLELVKLILSHKVFNLVLSEYLRSSTRPDRETIIAIMNQHLSRLNQRRFKSEVHRRLISLNRILQKGFYSQVIFWVYC